MAVPAWSRPATAVAIGGAGVLLAALALLVAPSVRMSLAFGSPWAPLLDTVLVEGPLLLAVVAAVWLASRAGFRRAVGLQRWNTLDLLAGAGLGLALRAIMELLAPTTGSLGGAFGPPDPITVAVLVIGAVLISPLVEELLFRGVLLRALQTALGATGRAVGAVVAVTLSTIAFVALHAVTTGAAVPWTILVSTAAVGLGCGVITVVTGRLGGALATHVVFNASGVLLLLT